MSILLPSSASESLGTNASPKRLHLGCGRTILEDWVNLDCFAAPGVDVVADLDRCREIPLPFEDDTFEELFASHLIEHIKDPLPMLQELHRVSKPGAQIVFRCPHGASDDAFEDPTHFRQYFPNSFMYFSQPAYWRADYGYRGDWQATHVNLVMDGKKFRGVELKDLEFNVKHLRNAVLEMIVTLTAIKPIREPLRDLLTMPVPNVVFTD